MEIINLRKHRKVFHLSFAWYGKFRIMEAAVTKRQWHIVTPVTFLTIGW